MENLVVADIVIVLADLDGGLESTRAVSKKEGEEGGSGDKTRKEMPLPKTQEAAGKDIIWCRGCANFL